MLLPWSQYRYYGDRLTIEQQYANMKRFVEYLGSIGRGNIVEKGYGDWYDPPAEGPQAQSIPMPKNTPVEKTSTAYYFLCARVLAQTAHVLGLTEDESRFGALARGVEAAYNAKFLDAARHSYGSQTADALALSFGIVPEGESGAVAGALVRDIVEKHSGHFSTGIHGAKVLYGGLSSTGHGNVAETILTQTSYPSIGYLFSLGATTMWENWSLTNNHLDKPRSRNHPMNTGFATWFFDRLGGIQLDADHPAYQAFVLRPDVRNSLTYVKATHRSPYGWIRSDWTIQNGTFTWKVEIPANSSARLWVPTRYAAGVTEGGQPAVKAQGLRLLREEPEGVVFEAGGGSYSLQAPVEPSRRKDVGN